MTHSSGFAPIAKSHREPLEGARRVGPVDPKSELTVSLIVRRGGSHDATAHAAELAQTAPAAREHVTPAEFAARFGASAEDLAKIHDFAERAGLEEVESDAARRTVVLRGSAEAMSGAFDVELSHYEHPQLGSYRGRTGTVGMPQELEGVVEAVLGLDDRPQAKPRMRRATEGASAGASEAAGGGSAAAAAGGESAAAAPGEGSTAAAAGGGSAAAAPAVARPFTPPQVAELYSFPTGAGRGQCIALIELGGGYEESDLSAYFQKLGVKAPTVVSVGVDGAANSPGIKDDDGEVVLDIDVAGSIANEATIAVYFAPNTDQGFVDAITTAVHDTTNNPSVISISWGGPEAQWTEQAMDAMDAAFADATLMGVTVCCAAGDHGAADGMEDGRAYADFPSASINTLGCGGTHLEADGASIALENVWNSGDGWATGGGVSEYFALPSWQEAANVPPSVNPEGTVGRGVPDVAGNADSSTGYRVHLNGQDAVFGGTSAVAPLWAALTAIINERLGARVGLLNPVLYTSPAATQGFRDIVEGKNEVGTTPGYEAVAGWDACTGLGSPNGEGLLSALTP